MIRLGSVSGNAPVRRAGISGSNPRPGEDFSLKINNWSNVIYNFNFQMGKMSILIKKSHLYNSNFVDVNLKNLKEEDFWDLAIIRKYMRSCVL